MKSTLLLVFTITLLLVTSCNLFQSEELANAVYLEPGPCCSNMELIGDAVFSDVVGYSETILFAVNFEETLLDLVDGDSLYIEFDFSDEEVPCTVICNRENAIPIELTVLATK